MRNCVCGHSTDEHSLQNPHPCLHPRCKCQHFCDEAWAIDETTIKIEPGTYPEKFIVEGHEMACPQCGQESLRNLVYRIGPEAYQDFMKRLNEHMQLPAHAIEHGFECSNCHAFIAQGGMEHLGKC